MAEDVAGPRHPTGPFRVGRGTLHIEVPAVGGSSSCLLRRSRAFLTVESAVNDNHKPESKARFEDDLAALDRAIAKLQEMVKKLKSDKAPAPPTEPSSDRGAKPPDPPGEKPEIDP